MVDRHFAVMRISAQQLCEVLRLPNGTEILHVRNSESHTWPGDAEFVVSHADLDPVADGCNPPVVYPEYSLEPIDIGGGVSISCRRFSKWTKGHSPPSIFPTQPPARFSIP